MTIRLTLRSIELKVYLEQRRAHWLTKLAKRTAKRKADTKKLKTNAVNLEQNGQQNRFDYFNMFYFNFKGVFYDYK